MQNLAVKIYLSDYLLRFFYAIIDLSMKNYNRKVYSPERKNSLSENSSFHKSQSNGESVSIIDSKRGNLAPPPISLIASSPPLQRKTNISQKEEIETDKKPKQKQSLHPIREALMKQFEKFDEQRIGDEKFDKDVMTEEAYDKTNKDYYAWVKKREERDRKYKELRDEVDKRNRGKKLKDREQYPPLPKLGLQPLHYTTCIAIQGIILKKAFDSIAKLNLKIKDTGSYKYNSKGEILANKDAHGEKIKSEKYNFSTFGHRQADEAGVHAWTKAEPGIGQRPQQGDILIFGKKTNAKNAARFVRMYKKSIFSIKEAIRKLNGDIDNVKNDKGNAETTLVILKETPDDIGDKNAQIRAQARAMEVIKNAKKQIAVWEGVIKEQENVLRLQKARLGAAQVSEQYHIDNLNFSHVGFFIEKSDEQITDEGVRVEKWKTFDGGQDVFRGNEGSKNGSKYSIRNYFPATNEISGEVSQVHLGGRKTLLSGWINVEKLVQKESEVSSEEGP